MEKRRHYHVQFHVDESQNMNYLCELQSQFWKKEGINISTKISSNPTKWNIKVHYKFASAKKNLHAHTCTHTHTEANIYSQLD